MYHRRTTIGIFAVALTAAAAGIALTAGTASAASGCSVNYTVQSQWAGGFTANVAITNLGDPVSSWTLKWSYTAGQTVTQAWNATVTQSGTAVTAVNVGYNGSIATNGSVSFGFNGSWNNSTNPAPASFTLNGITCTGATSTATGVVSSAAGGGVSPSASRTASASPSTSTSNGTPPTGTVRVYWLKPTDVAYNQSYPDGIAAVMAESQRYYQQELGKTFKLNSPVVEVVYGQHDTNWYITNNCTGTDHYWCVVFNMQQELMSRLGLTDPDTRWVNVGEVSAEETNQSGGGGGSGWVLLSGHDADGAAGVNGDLNRWYGGMIHELGHAFGLPDSTYTDGTPMSGSFYSYPNCHFTDSQKSALLNGPYGSFFS